MPQPSWKVNEIFYSIQGEGRHTGMPAVFLRLAGCTMGCSFCDTKYAFQTGEEMNSLQVLVALAEYPCKTVVITGGEPAEQDLPSLIAALKSAGYCVHLETNGAHDCDVSRADFVCVSPKKYVSQEMLKKADVIKIVVGQETDLADLEKYYNYENDKTQIYLQPESNLQENIALCVKLLKKHPAARLSLQTHKLINIR
ncbi:MAG: 7-carboxy-7-deazaguanine synthase QueE [Elusimicrobiaceae bacterium]|uniref:7-carboxy-7-deazaguanine synthase n=1 Tax=Candidatus Avelusimicrobium gallicola TaxID=2562704 RepID=A0A928HJ19_9BACT|nr:7-carboxy-7-deazaguanine synthase QueE [Elusimicrobium sp.]MBQ9970908.1 7-carboxy-7-deazaguanine synthase QueE [Elusimicrobiaceae bacterium]